MDKGYFRLATYEATDFIGISFEEDSRGRFVGIYRNHLNRALNLMLIVLKNYTFVSKNLNEKVDHGFYNQSIHQYTGSVGMVQRGQVDMVFPMVIPTNILSEGFAMTYAMEEGQLTIGTLTKAFKYKKIPLLMNLNALDSISWIFLIKFKHVEKIRFVLFFKKLFTTSIDYRNRSHFKLTILLTCLLIIRHICVVIFPNCLSSNYTVLDKSNLVVSLRDLLDQQTIVLTTALDGTTEFLKKTPILREYFDKLVQKLNKCGIFCYLETLNRHNYQILQNFANNRLSLISTKQIMTVMATTLCWLLNKNSLGEGDTNEILFYKIPVENTQQTYAWAITSDIKKLKLNEINLFSTKLMQSQVLDVLYNQMIDQYAPIVARIGPMFDQQDNIGSNLDTSHFVLKFGFFNSAFYLFLSLNLLIVKGFLLSRLYYRLFNRYNEKKKIEKPSKKLYAR